jgi:hypothetical protein
LLLSCIASICGIDTPQSAGIQYPFFKEGYGEEFKKYLCSDDQLTAKELEEYPFLSPNGMTLFGAYQFGGHRYWNKSFSTR